MQIPTAKPALTQPNPFFRWSDNPTERINMALNQALRRDDASFCASALSVQNSVSHVRYDSDGLRTC